ncbi:hypothetical protein [Allobaculum stercoricanis]|uniref:hypothetical protein n=1 Tax=Allobaculum stercoricanis TaxID=174709 RepID=UPI00037BC8E7|nr:hypothetical protein [Allobaculum stercoricanis]
MKMNLGKKSKSVIAIYAIILVVYIIGFLIIPFNKVAASWISFAFTIIAIAASLFVFNQAFNSKETLVSKIYGYPIFRVGAVYALAQLAIGIVICTIGAFVAVPYWVALLLSIIMLGAAAIGVIITDNTRDLVEHVDETVKVDTEVVTNFQIDIAGIVDCCEDSNLKSELEKLNDAFRFSDPVSNAKTKEAEDKINVLLNELKANVESNNVSEATALVKKITNALAERNRICKASKVH